MTTTDVSVMGTGLFCHRTKSTGSRCENPYAIDDTSFAQYFANDGQRCTRCGQQVDLWEDLTSFVRGLAEFPFGGLHHLAGASGLILTTKLKVGETLSIDIREHGAAPAAEILTLSMTSAGSAMPRLVQGNVIRATPFPPVFQLVGMPFGNHPDDGDLNLFIVWFDRSKDDTVVRHLVDATSQLEMKRFDAVVVPIQIAIEAAFAPVFTRALESKFSKNKTKDFVRATGHGNMMNVMLPLLAELVRAPKLPLHIVESCNGLRTLRNDIAHNGHTGGVSVNDAARYLSAALVAVQYAKVLDAFFPGASTP